MMKMQGEKHKEIESTQLLLKERFESDPKLPHGYFVLAEVQTGGRGRSDHSWISSPGNLHVSILLRDLPFAELTWIPHWISVCVLKALSDLGVDDSLIQLKWPNDLWIERSKKVAGILCEKKGESIIVGIGLNLLHSPDCAQETGSISQISNTFTPDEVLEKILAQLFLPANVLMVRNVYENHSLFSKGDLIEWNQDIDGGICSGFVIGLGIHGELLVKNNEQVIPLFSENIRATRSKKF